MAKMTKTEAEVIITDMLNTVHTKRKAANKILTDEISKNGIAVVMDANKHWDAAELDLWRWIVGMINEEMARGDSLEYACRSAFMELNRMRVASQNSMRTTQSQVYKIICDRIEGNVFMAPEYDQALGVLTGQKGWA